MSAITRRSNLREAHCHLPMLGRALSLIDVSMCHSLDELLHVLRERDKAKSASATDSSSTKRTDRATDWVIATGMRIEAWADPRWPSRHDLDRVCADRPCVVRSFDFHSLVANSAALAAAGISHTTLNPDAGVLVRDADGALTGVALEAAEALILRAIPEPDVAQRRQHVLDAIVHLRHLGFVEAHDLKSPPWLGPELANLADADALDIQIELYPLVDEADATMKSRHLWERDQVRLGGFKLFADGTLNSRTAWMLHPYADAMPDHPCGLPNWTPEQITEAVRVAERCGVALATHAIGDAAVRAVLNAIQAVRQEFPHSRVRHRIEHAEVIDASDVQRFAGLNVIASVQPCHLLYDIPVLRRAVPHRLDRVLPLRELIQSGCVPGDLLWFGSDAPIVPADPVASVAAAVGRGELDVRGGIAAGIEPIASQQRLTEEESWRAFQGA
jgi:predicted amidohydrolase YtcJ